MADYSELEQPGIEVLQVFQTESATVITPTLMPTVLAVCNQVVNVLVDDGTGTYTLNTAAQADTPAYAVFAEGPYDASSFISGGVGLYCAFSLNKSPELQIQFPAAWAAYSSISPQQLVDFLNGWFEDYNLYQSIYAYVFGAAVIVSTINTGDNMQFSLRAPTSADMPVIEAFGIGQGHTFYGFSTYKQRAVTIPEWSFPDPRGNLSQLTMESDTVRGFLYMGHGLDVQEGNQGQTFLRWGNRTDSSGSYCCSDIRVVADGSGNPTSTLIAFNDGNTCLEDLTAASTPLAVAGTAITFPTTTLAGKLVSIDYGEGVQTLKFLGEAADSAGLIAMLATAFDPGVVGDRGLAFSVDGSGKMTITSNKNGVDAFLQLIAQTDPTTDALTLLGLTAMPAPLVGDRQTSVTATYSVQPHPVRVGDYLYVDGVYLGEVLQVAPRGVTAQYKGEVLIDTAYAVTPTGQHFGTAFYFVANGLPGQIAQDRPDPDLVVDQDTGDTTFKTALARDTTGAWYPLNLATYIQYTALRKDVSPEADNPALLVIDTTTMLTSLVEPIDSTNPFGVGMYMALLNSSGAQVSGIGIDERSAVEPWGTVDAYTRAFTFLEAKEVYAIAPLTPEFTVAQIANAHATLMSEPEYKGERVIVFCLPKPTRFVDTLAASGQCDRLESSASVNTHIASLSSILVANGIDVSGDIPAGNLYNGKKGGVYIQIADDGNYYSVKRVTGTTVTIRYQPSDFEYGSNDDNFFYAAGTLPTTPWISFDFDISIRGAELLLPDGTVDKDSIANTYQDLGNSFSSRRFWNLVLDTCQATLNGISQSLPGFYMCAAYVGLIGGQPPQQSFTNFPIVGFTTVTGTNDYFSSRQLNRIAAGGNTIIVQDPPQNGPIFPRMALTTDMTSVETRTDSITKCLDFTAKFLRRSLRIFIGRFNINQGFLDTLSHVVQGLLQFLTGSFILVDADINNIVQSDSEPDTVMLDITVDPPYPCNYIQVRLIV